MLRASDDGGGAEGKASGIMCSVRQTMEALGTSASPTPRATFPSLPQYNEVNGVPSCANEWLLGTLLRGSWEFVSGGAGHAEVISSELARARCCRAGPGVTAPLVRPSYCRTAT